MTTMNVTSNSSSSETGAPSLGNQRKQEKNEGNDDAPSTSLEDSPPKQNSARKTILLATLSSAGLLNILTVQSVVIMLPSIGEALQIPPTRQQMITSTYNISAGCLILFWGRLADIYGRRTTFLIGSTGFTLAALAIPFSPVEICFYVLRVLQGMSGAATIPSAIGILATTFPVGKSRNMAFVTFAAASSLGSIIGNVAGGVVGGYLSWKWVFWITSIISGTVTMAAYILTRHKSFTQRPQGSTDTYVDWLGGVIISSSLILLLVALSEANVIGWKVPWISVLLVLSVLLGAAFVFWQLRLEKHACRQPLLRPAMFRNMQFSASFTLIGLFYAAFNGFLIFSTFFYQDYQELEVIDTTLRFLPAGITGLFVSFIVTPALSRIPGYYLLVFGIVCGIVSPLLFALPTISPDTTYWAFGFPAMFLGFSVDIVAPVVSLFVAKCLPEGDQALGAGLLQTANQVGRALGLAVATIAQSAAQGGSHEKEDLLRGLRAAQWVNVALTILALAIALMFFRGLGKA